MLTDVKIQRLPPDQWEEYKNIRLEALKREPQAFMSPYSKELAYPDEKWKQRLTNVGNGKNWILFARNSSGKIVGMIGGYRDDNAMQNHSAEIWGVYVNSDMRGKGIAKALMAGIIGEFEKDPDVYSATLEVNTDQESAKKLYESFGFNITTSRQLVLGDGKEHTVSKMEKPLEKH